MKHVFLSFCLLFSSLSLAQVLLEHGGYSLSQSLVDDVITTTEFMADQPLSAQDKQSISDWLMVDFPYNPPFWINQETSFAQTVQRIRNTPDAQGQLALRDNLFQHFYFGIAEEPEIAHMESFMDVVLRYDPVVFQDDDNQLAITQKRYSWSVLAENGSHVLTRHDLSRLTQVAAFLAAQPLNAQDRADLEDWMQATFASYPAEMTSLRGTVLQTLERITQSAHNFYERTKVRESLYAAYYLGLKDTEYDRGTSLLSIIARYNPVYEVNRDNPAVLSQSLVDFHLAIYEVVAGIVGEDGRITQTIRDNERRHAAAWVANSSKIGELIDVTSGVLGTWYEGYSDADRANTLPQIRENFLSSSGNWEAAIDPVAASYFAQRKADYLMSQQSLNSMMGMSQQFNQMMEVHNQMDICASDPACLGVEVFDGNGNFLGGF